MLMSAGRRTFSSISPEVLGSLPAYVRESIAVSILASRGRGRVYTKDLADVVQNAMNHG